MYITLTLINHCYFENTFVKMSFVHLQHVTINMIISEKSLFQHHLKKCALE